MGENVQKGGDHCYSEKFAIGEIFFLFHSLSVIKCAMEITLYVGTNFFLVREEKSVSLILIISYTGDRGLIGGRTRLFRRREDLP
jgi:hypothetical protein